MTTYSDWVQGGDVTGTSTGFSGADLRQTRTTTSSERTTYASGGNDAGVVSPAVTSERNRGEPVEYLTPQSSSYTFMAQTYVEVGATQDPPYAFSTGVVRNDYGMTVNASTVISQWQSTYASTIALPPGASGVELESATFVPVAASITLPATDSAVNGLDGSVTVTTQMVIDFYVRPASQPAPAVGRLALRHTTTASNPAVYYSMSIDAQGADLDPGNGALILLPLANYALSPDWSVSGAPVPRYAGWNVGRQWSVTSDPVSTLWTLRPPRYRFVYDAAPYVPPLALYPTRGDGLGADSHRTLYPPPQTLQGGQGGIRGGFL